jgi:hypothetical protein
MKRIGRITTDSLERNLMGFAESGTSAVHPLHHYQDSEWAK